MSKPVPFYGRDVSHFSVAQLYNFSHTTEKKSWAPNRSIRKLSSKTSRTWLRFLTSCCATNYRLCCDESANRAGFWGWKKWLEIARIPFAWWAKNVGGKRGKSGTSSVSASSSDFSGSAAAGFAAPKMLFVK